MKVSVHINLCSIVLVKSDKSFNASRVRGLFCRASVVHGVSVQGWLYRGKVWPSQARCIVCVIKVVERNRVFDILQQITCHSYHIMLTIFITWSNIITVSHP